MSFLDEIANRLVAQGVGVLNTSIFRSSKATIPPGPGPFITITETGGSGPTRVHNKSGASTQRPTAQIMVRASTYETARAKAKEAYDALDGVYNTTLSGTFYQSITARQEPTDIAPDDGAGRAMVAFNIDAEKLPS